MPALIGLPDQRQGRRDPGGRPVFLPTPAYYDTSPSANTAVSCASITAPA
jgi:hypothetical protein